jgi:hypothetical protein
MSKSCLILLTLKEQLQNKNVLPKHGLLSTLDFSFNTLSKAQRNTADVGIDHRATSKAYRETFLKIFIFVLWSHSPNLPYIKALAYKK